MELLLTSAGKIVKALNGRWGIGGAMCPCPAHRDRTPSLSITERSGKILLHCFAGCSRAAVISELQRLGFWTDESDSPSDLTEEEKQRLRQRRINRDRARERSAAFIEGLWRRTWAEAK